MKSGRLALQLIRHAASVGAAVLALFMAGDRPSLAQAFSLDLDTYDGHFSTWTMDKVGGATTFVATIKASRVGHAKGWTPFVRFQVRTANAWQGLLVYAPTGDPPFQFFAVQGDVSHPKPQDRFSGALNLNESADIELSWESKGTLVIHAAGGSRELPLAGPVLGLEVISGTAEFEVRDIQIR